MADIKKYVSADKEKSLKRKDAKKDGGTSVHHVAALASQKKIPDSMIDPDFSNVKVKKKLPIAVDVIAGILMILIVIGAVVGSYLLFRYYSNDYDSKKITYDIIVDATEEYEQYKHLIKQDVYLDTADNSLYFGQIVRVEKIEGETDRVLIRISATAKYRNGEGYSLGEKRIAVGSEFLKLRCGEKSLGGATVVKLTANGGK